VFFNDCNDPVCRDLLRLLSCIYISFINPVEVLKGTMNPGSMSGKLRSILVVFQFTVSIIIIIGSIVVYNQLNLITRKDLGFEKENLIIISEA